MKFLYILFFTLLDFLLFTQLSGKIRFPKKAIIISIFCLLGMYIVHSFDPMDQAISNDEFNLLFFFSVTYIFGFFGVKSTIWINKKIHRELDENLVKMLYFIVFYILFGMIYIVQLGTIITKP